MATAANIRVLGFKQEAYILKDGSRGFRDRVFYAPAHSPNSVVNSEIVSRLKPLEAYQNDETGLKSVAMNSRWQDIAEHYKAWKEGREIPESGTPLATWPGVTDDQCEVLRSVGFKTVEDVANMSDGSLNKVMMPGVRDLREQARRFLSSLDANQAAEQLRRRDEKIAAMEEQLADLMSQRKGAASVGDDVPDSDFIAKRSPGRPRKAGPMTVAESLEADSESEAA